MCSSGGSSLPTACGWRASASHGGPLLKPRVRLRAPRRCGRVARALTFATLRYEVADSGVATIAMDQPDTRNALSDELLGELIAAFEAARDDDGRALRRARLHARDDVQLGRQPRRLRRRRPARAQARRHRALPAAVHAHRRARQAGDLRGQRPLPGRGARAGAGLRPDRGRRAGDLRHARDQRRRLPVHDPRAHRAQRPAQEGDRDAAARRALRRARGRAPGDRQPRGGGRGARRGGGRLGAAARRQVAAC